jgi:transcriptional regulator with XRE-family HTH domain
MPDVSRDAVMRAFGDAVRECRVERDLSQEGLAEAAGLHRTYIGDVERGNRNVSLFNVVRIAVGLELSFAELAARAEARWAGDRPSRSG